MGLINGGTLFGKALAKEGIEKAFVLVGGHILPILQGMRREGIEVIDMRHECSAMYAAIACARVTGKPVAVATTAGPGSLNAIPGMMEAIGSCMPIIHIGGATSVPEMDTASLQDMPTLKIQETCSKWARRVTGIEKIPFYISMALRHAMEGNPGPVYIEAPSDLVYGTVEEENVFWPEKARAHTIPHGDFASVEAAADLLVNAKRPAAIYGDGARFNIGVHAKDVAALSDYLKMPMSSQIACKGLFGSEYENSLLKTFGLGEADVILSMGMRWDFRIRYGHFIPKHTKIIQVHTDATQIGFNLRADIGIVGGAGPVTSQILQVVKRKRDKPVEKSWIDIPEGNPLDRVSERFKQGGSPVHPSRLAWEVAKFLSGEGRDWNFAIDGGDISIHMWDSGTVTANGPGQVQGSGPSGMIGMGTPLLIGAWIANRKPGLLITGDGSFGFYGMEMETMARLGMPAIVVISNDAAWGMIRLEEKYSMPNEVAELGHTSTELFDKNDNKGKIRAYEKMVAMWDGYGELVTEPEEIIPAIKRAVVNGKPSIINVEVDREALSSWTQPIADRAAELKKAKLPYME